MRRNGRIIRTLIAAIWMGTVALQAQELNCKLQINSSKIQTTDKAIFKNLEEALNNLINQRKWTELNVNSVEKIDCSVTIIINEMPSEEQFKSELQIAVSRPVYNTSYTTPTFMFKDNDFNFSYQDMQQIEFNSNYIQDNLTAVIAFYVYIVLGIDMDTFSPMGGEGMFRQAESIANAAQSIGETGWKAFESERNRHALISSLLDDKMKPMRELSYNYHRLGLDEMQKDAEQSRGKITNYLKSLNSIYEINPTNVLLQMFVETKIDEIVQLYSKASASEKKTIFDLLSLVAPTMSNRYKTLQ